MMKFLFPGGGQKVNLTDIKDLHDELININEALVIGVGGCVLSGLVVSGAQGSANISAGWCYLDGEYVYLPAQSSINFTANPTQYIVKGAAVESRPKNFVTGGLKNTRSTKNATIVTTLPVSGDYITIKFEGHSQSYVEVIGRKIEPIGTIKMCNSVASFNAGTGLGTGIWKGWSLCNGQNGTLDMRGRFPVGYDTSDVDYDAIDKLGGAKAVTLTIAQMPSHNHTFTLTENDAGNSIATGGSGSGGTQTTASQGGGASHENRPPFRTLAFVQKIA